MSQPETQGDVEYKLIVSLSAAARRRQGHELREIVMRGLGIRLRSDWEEPKIAVVPVARTATLDKIQRQNLFI